ncbi:LacI family DNA-binding transcriptional regulator [Phaeovulum sp.]|uniref:LacI family DNA-binding transcriptional regulator n=1 Tax=Phaeovulum sp. TaxID=2934796 RepID=UPI0035624EF8
MTFRAPSIRDVAKVAGVSTASVSRTLSNPELVSEATRALVFDAVQQTGYRINVSARNLRKQATSAIAVLVPNLANPFFARILSGIAEVMSDAGFSVLITDTTPMSLDDHHFPVFLSLNQTDGLIVLDGLLARDALLNRGTPATRAPMVFACEWNENLVRPSVTIDNEAAAGRAMDHLISLGHRRIGVLNGPRDNVLTKARFKGAEAAIHAAGLELPQRWIYDGDFTLQSGVRAAAHWHGAQDRPTAIFCASDEMAMGFIGELNQRAVKVPDEVSVVGFDDLEIAAHFVPPLTTIHQPREAIGRAAARMLLDRMNLSPQEREHQPVPKLVLPVDLVIRKSTAPPPG